MKEGSVYILKNSKSDSYYIGSSVNLQRRLQEHVDGKSKYTNKEGVWMLVYSQKYKDVKDARRIEHKLKRFKSRKIIERIIRDNKILIK